MYACTAVVSVARLRLYWSAIVVTARASVLAAAFLVTAVVALLPASSPTSLTQGSPK
jgi:hypothetical protein